MAHARRATSSIRELEAALGYEIFDSKRDDCIKIVLRP
jgi:hypothetical protein